MNTTYTTLTRTYYAIAWSLCVALTFPGSLHAETVINNSVSVTSSTGGDNSTARASIHTTINGATVEDVMIESNDGEAISYTSSQTYEDETLVRSTTTAATTSRDQETQQELKTLLERLVALLTYYVSKLSL